MVQNSYRGKELNKCCPTYRSDELYLCFWLHPSSTVCLWFCIHQCTGARGLGYSGAPSGCTIPLTVQCTLWLNYPFNCAGARCEVHPDHAGPEAEEDWGYRRLRRNVVLSSINTFFTMNDGIFHRKKIAFFTVKEDFFTVRDVVSHSERCVFLSERWRF